MMQSELFKHCNFDSIMKSNFTTYLIGTATIISTIYLIRRAVKSYRYNKKIHKKTKEVNDRKVSLLQKLEGMVVPFDNIKHLCNLTGNAIIKKLQSGDITAVDLLEAYQANAFIKNNELNFISDVIYDADVSALLITGKEGKSLLGWPLSIKDAVSIEKYDCTQGLPSKIFQPCSKSSVIIRALKEEGAIPFIITNVCQGLQTMEASNPIFGVTLNPFNHKMTCGGSSGGEGAALGSESSLIGIGSDIGGSIRIPASYCGVFGLKPTSSRVSTRHSDKTYSCDLIVNISIGPMARYIDDLITTFKAMTTEHVFSMDPYCPPVPFNEQSLLSTDRLKIGFYTHIGGQQAHPIPSVARAVATARKALEAAGHELVEFALPNIDMVADISSKVFFIDGGKRLVKDGLKDGPIDPSLKSMVRLLRRSRYVKYVISSICGVVSRKLGQSIWSTAGLSVYETWELNEQILTYRESVLSLLEEKGIDGIICPVLPMAAPPVNTCNTLAETDIYCTVYNLLDYPAGSVPVTVVSEEDIKDLENAYRPVSAIDKCIKRFQKNSKGLPIGVQCVARPWREETCLRIMKDISFHL